VHWKERKNEQKRKERANRKTSNFNSFFLFLFFFLHFYEPVYEYQWILQPSPPFIPHGKWLEGNCGVGRDIEFSHHIKGGKINKISKS
jgi:hypothetical protein